MQPSRPRGVRTEGCRGGLDILHHRASVPNLYGVGDASEMEMVMTCTGTGRH